MVWLIVILSIAGYALGAAYFGMRNLKVQALACEQTEDDVPSTNLSRAFGCLIRGQGCRHDWNMLVGYFVWPVAYPCTIVSGLAKSSHAERKHQRNVASLERAHRLQTMECTMAIENTELLQKIQSATRTEQPPSMLDLS